MLTPIRHEVSLIADPIHQYIQFTVPSSGSTETTEKDLIDSPWSNGCDTSTNCKARDGSIRPRNTVGSNIL